MGKTQTDLSYRRSADGLFVSFYPNTPEGENVWRSMNTTPGSECGVIFARHLPGTLAQIRKFGYTVRAA